jgi:hypothetical protein
MPAFHACADPVAPCKKTVLFCPVPANIQAIHDRPDDQPNDHRHDPTAKKLQSLAFCENVIAKRGDRQTG